MKLRGAVLFAKDLERLLTFYRDGLGFAAGAGAVCEGWVELRSDGGRLVLHAIPAQIAREIHIESPPRPRSDTALKLVFEVDDLAATRAHLASHGATMREPTSWGSCDGVDPEGNVFQIVKA